MTKRQTYELTPEEEFRLDKLAYEFRDGHAFKFWKDVAAARGLDYRTILAAWERGFLVRNRFTALPLGRTRAWCHPIPLKCPMTAAEAMAAAGR